RCDNGTEFKNREMNQFCEMKGILRQFSVVRTPQQNRAAERRNMPLIEAARTMIPGSKTPTLSFMRPFGCPVTILNTIDHLGKFDGKVDEGFFVGYSLNSKAFRVFNSRTRIVEENLHIKFIESTPNVVGSGPDWLFDIDALTRTMNYEPIVAGTMNYEPTTRIYKDHPLDQVIVDLQSATETRKMSNNLEEHGFVSTILQITNHKDLQNCLFACFLSPE
ncbi:retrovirus-related pol polyprotein from transposon TNT 1-94, partial [Tanacetum coccineum]